MSATNKFRLYQTIRIWGRNKGEIVGLPSTTSQGSGVYYEVEWTGFHGQLTAKFEEHELSEE